MTLLFIHFNFATLGEAKKFIAETQKKIPNWYIFSCRLAKQTSTEEKGKYKAITLFNDYKGWLEALAITLNIAEKYNYVSYKIREY